jgi:hypothetical protein
MQQPTLPGAWEGLEEQHIIDTFHTHKAELARLGRFDKEGLTKWATSRGYVALLCKLLDELLPDHRPIAFANACYLASREGSLQILTGLLCISPLPSPVEYWGPWCLMDAVNGRHLACAERLLQISQLDRSKISTWALQKLLLLLLRPTGPFAPSPRAWDLVLRSDRLLVADYARLAHLYPQPTTEGSIHLEYAIGKLKDVPDTSAEGRLVTIREAAWKRRRHLCIDRALWRKPAVAAGQEAKIAVGGIGDAANETKSTTISSTNPSDVSKLSDQSTITNEEEREEEH